MLSMAGSIITLEPSPTLHKKIHTPLLTPKCPNSWLVMSCLLLISYIPVMLCSTRNDDRKAVHPLPTRTGDAAEGITPWGYQSESKETSVNKATVKWRRIMNKDLRRATSWVTEDLGFPAESRQNLNTIRPKP
jgi:hypothetical protein